MLRGTRRAGNEQHARVFDEFRVSQVYGLTHTRTTEYSTSTCTCTCAPLPLVLQFRACRHVVLVPPLALSSASCDEISSCPFWRLPSQHGTAPERRHRRRSRDGQGPMFWRALGGCPSHGEYKHKEGEGQAEEEWQQDRMKRPRRVAPRGE